MEGTTPVNTGREAVNEVATITPQMLEDARSLIGVWLRRDVHARSFAEDIAPIDIRRWAHFSIGDDNPLWSDSTYARGTRWGEVVAPPTFLYSVDSTIVAPGLRGVQWIYGGTRWTHHRAVRPGDRITARARLISVEEKSGQHAPSMVVQTGETLFYDQRDELVARAEADVLRIPRARSGKGMVGFDEQRAKGPWRYSESDIEKVRQGYRDERRRGAEPRYWEDVEVGAALDPILKGPLTMVDILAFYVGRRNTYPPLKLAFEERERHPSNVYVSPTTGVPVHPAAGHIDDEIAKEVGMPGRYDQGWMRANWMGHLVTNWAGDDSFVRRLDIRLHRPNIVGDLTTCTGRVVAKSQDPQDRTVELELVGTSQRGETNMSGRAVVELPGRSL